MNSVTLKRIFKLTTITEEHHLTLKTSVQFVLSVRQDKRKRKRASRQKKALTMTGIVVGRSKA